MNGLYVTITNTSGSGDTFTSTVTISPVNTTDTASYTCTARVNPTAIDSDFIISSMESVDTVNVTVESESTMCIIIQHHLFTSHLDVFHPFSHRVDESSSK